MTARTTTLRGLDAGRYYVEDQLGYYLDRSEPPRVWRGRGAAVLGLEGTVDESTFLTLMEGVDPNSGQLLGTAHTNRTVRGFDVTCSAPKSVSVLMFLGDERTQQEIADGHDVAVAAVTDWIERHAHCRYRSAGVIGVHDADGIIAATFRQHTSRALDPQLHTHVVVVNRVQSLEGRWLALDARTIKRDQQTLSRIYQSTLRAELTSRLGLRWREPVNGTAEVRDVPDHVLAEFSSRTADINARIDDKIERFNESMERSPTPRERWRLEREAVLDSRPHKEDVGPAVLAAEWRSRLLGLGVTREDLVTAAIERERHPLALDDTRRHEVAERALAALAEKQSTWRPAEVVRELAGAVPTGVAASAEELAAWIDRLAAELIRDRMIDLSRPIPEGSPLRRDGRPITESCVDRALTLPEVIAEEERLIALAERRHMVAGQDRPTGHTEQLSPAQELLAAAVAGDRSLVLAVGPAGTGKTTALRPAVDQLRQDGRAVFGVAPSAAAAEVLAADTGVDADTLDKLLIEHRLIRPPDHRYALPSGATVVVDEAAMVPTPRLLELFELAEQRGWRMALVGDPLQFAAVGRSGMFGHLVSTFGAIELGRVHRFTAAWERDASLRLRRGDASVVDVYDEHGRLHGGTDRQMRAEAVDAWWSAWREGLTPSLTAPTNTAVVALNQAAQQHRLAAGELDGPGNTVVAGPYRLHAGDVVATRQNDRKLLTDRHLMVKNRDRWTVEAAHRDGSLSVAGPGGRVRLPAMYVTDHVELAYAETSHASQGRTVDRSFLYLDGPAGAAGIYVPLTRGRETNEAFVVLRDEESAADVVAEALERTWVDRPAVQVRDELHPRASDDGGRSALLDPAQLRDLFARLATIDTRLRHTQSEAERLRNEADAASRAVDQASRTLRAHESRLDAAARILAEHDRPFRRRGHRSGIEAAQRDAARLPATVAEARHRLVELERERAVVDDAVHSVLVDVRRAPALVAEAAGLRLRIDADAQQRGEVLAKEGSPVLPQRFGPPPLVGPLRASWVDAAARLAQHHLVVSQSVDTLPSRHPTSARDGAVVMSERMSVESLERLDRALGRQLEVEPPQRSLGISL